MVLLLELSCIAAVGYRGPTDYIMAGVPILMASLAIEETHFN